ncbi:head maturation protease, ClpP-related [Zavarzinia aquatilis]|uniref:ATP-dependent Clp protease proteolytic subunit n=1 Tax=Zavarzinia aquatilis TaxID=2211142 RepID=A0A317EE75_9PROT|nr:head maturation protease, ClpP-related [Zavarzinia aquatilis]PWR24564.1 peptidase [Zavarzinia aquatilis]
MSLRELPKISALERPDGYEWDPSPDLLEKWSAGPIAAEADDPSTISIYEQIGGGIWSEGFTGKRMAGALRSIGPKPVTVKINSVGGDVFEGLTIYNLLAEHPAKVTVKVMGIAASAASFIAMAGDEIVMGLGSMLMIHNAQAGIIDNRHGLRLVADYLETVDGAMTDIYEARSGLARKAIVKMMDDETYLSAREAVDKRFADMISSDPVPPASSARADRSARASLDILLARQGVPRAERRRLLRDATGTPGAAVPATPCAGIDMAAAARLLATLKS